MRQFVTTLAELAGATLLSIGAFHVSPAVGFSTTGGLLILGGALGARGGA